MWLLTILNKLLHPSSEDKGSQMQKVSPKRSRLLSAITRKISIQTTFRWLWLRCILWGNIVLFTRKWTWKTFFIQILALIDIKYNLGGSVGPFSQKSLYGSTRNPIIAVWMQLCPTPATDRNTLVHMASCQWAQMFHTISSSDLC
jgi:hypothetical protein